MSIIYRYFPELDQTIISDPANTFFHRYEGQVPYKLIHEQYGVIVFEIIKPNPILLIDEQKDEPDILDT